MLPRSLRPKPSRLPYADPITTIKELPDPISSPHSSIPIGFVSFDPKVFSPAAKKEFKRVMSLFARRYTYYQLPLFDADITDTPYREALIYAGLLIRYIPDELHYRADKGLLVMTPKGLTYSRIFGSSQPLLFTDGDILTISQVHEWLADRLITNGAHPLSLRAVRELTTKPENALPSTYQKGSKKPIYVNYADLEPYYHFMVEEDMHRKYLHSEAVSDSNRKQHQRRTSQTAALAFNAEAAAQHMAARMLKLNPNKYIDCPVCECRGWMGDPSNACEECKGLGLIERDKNVNA